MLIGFRWATSVSSFLGRHTGPGEREGGMSSMLVSKETVTHDLCSQMWTEMPKGKNKKPVNKDRFISKMFLR